MEEKVALSKEQIERMEALQSKERDGKLGPEEKQELEQLTNAYFGLIMSKVDNSSEGKTNEKGLEKKEKTENEVPAKKEENRKNGGIPFLLTVFFFFLTVFVFHSNLLWLYRQKEEEYLQKEKNVTRKQI